MKLFDFLGGRGFPPPTPEKVAECLEALPGAARFLAPELVDAALEVPWLTPVARDLVAGSELARALIGSDAARALRLSRILGAPSSNLPLLGAATGDERVENVVASFVAAARSRRGIAPEALRRPLDQAVELVRPPAGASLGSRFPLLVHFGDQRPSWLEPAGVAEGSIDPHLRLTEPLVEDSSGEKGSFGAEVETAARRAMDTVRQVEGPSAPRTGYTPLRVSLHGVSTFVDGPSFGLPLLAVFGLAVRHGSPLPRTVALTGAIDEHGRLAPVGGVAAKARAAWRSGARLMIVPEKNARELEGLDVRLRVEAIEDGLSGVDLLLALERVIDAHFAHSLRFSDADLRAEYLKIEQRTRPHAGDELMKKWLELVESHAQRRAKRSDLHRTIAACCLWLRAYHSHQGGKPDDACQLLSRAERRFESLYARGRLDPIAFSAWAEIDNLRGIRAKFDYEHARSRRFLRKSLAAKMDMRSPFPGRRSSLGATLGSLGQLDAGVGRFRRARRRQREAMRLVPEEERNRQRNYLGLLYAAWGKWERGERILERVLTDDATAPPEDATRHSNATHAYYNRLTLRWWRADAEPHSPRAQQHRERALEDASRVLERGAKHLHPGARRAEGACLRGLGRLNEARECLEQARKEIEQQLARGSSGRIGQLIATKAELSRLALAKGEDPHLRDLLADLEKLPAGARRFAKRARRLVTRAASLDAALFELVRRLLR